MTTAPPGVTWLGYPLPASQWPIFTTYQDALEFVEAFVKPALVLAYGKSAPTPVIVDGANTPVTFLGGPPVAIVLDGEYQEEFKPSTPQPNPGDVSSWVIMFQAQNCQCMDHVGDLENRQRHPIQIDRPWAAPAGPFLNLIVLEGPAGQPGVIEFVWATAPQTSLQS